MLFKKLFRTEKAKEEAVPLPVGDDEPSDPEEWDDEEFEEEEEDEEEEMTQQTEDEPAPVLVDDGPPTNLELPSAVAAGSGDAGLQDVTMAALLAGNKKPPQTARALALSRTRAMISHACGVILLGFMALTCALTPSWPLLILFVIMLVHPLRLMAVMVDRKKRRILPPTPPPTPKRVAIEEDDLGRSGRRRRGGRGGNNNNSSGVYRGGASNGYAGTRGSRGGGDGTAGGRGGITPAAAGGSARASGSTRAAGSAGPALGTPGGPMNRDGSPTTIASALRKDNGSSKGKEIEVTVGVVSAWRAVTGPINGGDWWSYFIIRRYQLLATIIWCIIYVVALVIFQILVVTASPVEENYLTVSDYVWYDLVGLYDARPNGDETLFAMVFHIVVLVMAIVTLVLNPHKKFESFIPTMSPTDGEGGAMERSLIEAEEEDDVYDRLLYKHLFSFFCTSRGLDKERTLMFSGGAYDAQSQLMQGGAAAMEGSRRGRENESSSAAAAAGTPGGYLRGSRTRSPPFLLPPINGNSGGGGAQGISGPVCLTPAAAAAAVAADPMIQLMTLSAVASTTLHPIKKSSLWIEYGCPIDVYIVPSDFFPPNYDELLKQKADEEKRLKEKKRRKAARDKAAAEKAAKLAAEGKDGAEAAVVVDDEEEEEQKKKVNNKKSKSEKKGKKSSKRKGSDRDDDDDDEDSDDEKTPAQTPSATTKVNLAFGLPPLSHVILTVQRHIHVLDMILLCLVTFASTCIFPSFFSTLLCLLALVLLATAFATPPPAKTAKRWVNSVTGFGNAENGCKTYHPEDDHTRHSHSRLGTPILGAKNASSAFEMHGSPRNGGGRNRRNSNAKSPGSPALLLSSPTGASATAAGGGTSKMLDGHNVKTRKYVTRREANTTKWLTHGKEGGSCIGCRSILILCIYYLTLVLLFSALAMQNPSLQRFTQGRLEIRSGLRAAGILNARYCSRGDNQQYLQFVPTLSSTAMVVNLTSNFSFLSLPTKLPMGLWSNIFTVSNPANFTQPPGGTLPPVSILQAGTMPPSTITVITTNTVVVGNVTTTTNITKTVRVDYGFVREWVNQVVWCGTPTSSLEGSLLDVGTFFAMQKALAMAQAQGVTPNAVPLISFENSSTYLGPYGVGMGVQQATPADQISLGVAKSPAVDAMDVPLQYNLHIFLLFIMILLSRRVGFSIFSFVVVRRRRAKLGCPLGAAYAAAQHKYQTLQPSSWGSVQPPQVYRAGSQSTRAAGAASNNAAGSTATGGSLYGPVTVDGMLECTKALSVLHPTNLAFVVPPTAAAPPAAGGPAAGGAFGAAAAASPLVKANSGTYSSSPSGPQQQGVQGVDTRSAASPAGASPSAPTGAAEASKPPEKTGGNHDWAGSVSNSTDAVLDGFQDIVASILTFLLEKSFIAVPLIGILTCGVTPTVLMIFPLIYYLFFPMLTPQSRMAWGRILFMYQCIYLVMMFLVITFLLQGPILFDITWFVASMYLPGVYGDANRVAGSGVGKGTVWDTTYYNDPTTGSTTLPNQDPTAMNALSQQSMGRFLLRLLFIGSMNREVVTYSMIPLVVRLFFHCLSLTALVMNDIQTRSKLAVEEYFTGKDPEVAELHAFQEKYAKYIAQIASEVVELEDGTAKAVAALGVGSGPIGPSGGLGGGGGNTGALVLSSGAARAAAANGASNNNSNIPAASPGGTTGGATSAQVEQAVAAAAAALVAQGGVPNDHPGINPENHPMMRCSALRHVETIAAKKKAFRALRYQANVLVAKRKKAMKIVQDAVSIELLRALRSFYDENATLSLSLDDGVGAVICNVSGLTAPAPPPQANPTATAMVTAPLAADLTPQVPSELFFRVFLPNYIGDIILKKNERSLVMQYLRTRFPRKETERLAGLMVGDSGTCDALEFMDFDDCLLVIHLFNEHGQVIAKEQEEDFRATAAPAAAAAAAPSRRMSLSNESPARLSMSGIAAAPVASPDLNGTYSLLNTSTSNTTAPKPAMSLYEERRMLTGHVSDNLRQRLFQDIQEQQQRKEEEYRHKAEIAAAHEADAIAASVTEPKFEGFEWGDVQQTDSDRKAQSAARKEWEKKAAGGSKSGTDSLTQTDQQPDDFVYVEEPDYKDLEDYDAIEELDDDEDVPAFKHPTEEEDEVDLLAQRYRPELHSSSSGGGAAAGASGTTSSSAAAGKTSSTSAAASSTAVATRPQPIATDNNNNNVMLSITPASPTTGGATNQPGSPKYNPPLDPAAPPPPAPPGLGSRLVSAMGRAVRQFLRYLEWLWFLYLEVIWYWLIQNAILPLIGIVVIAFYRSRLSVLHLLLVVACICVTWIPAYGGIKPSVTAINVQRTFLIIATGMVIFVVCILYASQCLKDIEFVGLTIWEGMSGVTGFENSSMEILLHFFLVILFQIQLWACRWSGWAQHLAEDGSSPEFSVAMMLKMKLSIDKAEHLVATQNATKTIGKLIGRTDLAVMASVGTGAGGGGGKGYMGGLTTNVVTADALTGQFYVVEPMEGHSFQMRWVGIENRIRRRLGLNSVFLAQFMTMMVIISIPALFLSFADLSSPTLPILAILVLYLIHAVAFALDANFFFRRLTYLGWMFTAFYATIFLSFGAISLVPMVDGVLLSKMTPDSPSPYVTTCLIGSTKKLQYPFGGLSLPTFATTLTTTTIPVTTPANTTGLVRTTTTKPSTLAPTTTIPPFLEFSNYTYSQKRCMRELGAAVVGYPHSARSNTTGVAGSPLEPLNFLAPYFAFLLVCIIQATLLKHVYLHHISQLNTQEQESQRKAAVGDDVIPVDEEEDGWQDVGRDRKGSVVAFNASGTVGGEDEDPINRRNRPQHSRAVVLSGESLDASAQRRKDREAQGRLERQLNNEPVGDDDYDDEDRATPPASPRSEKMRKQANVQQLTRSQVRMRLFMYAVLQFITANADRICWTAFIVALLMRSSLLNIVYILFFVFDFRGILPLVYSMLHILILYVNGLSVFPNDWSAEWEDYLGLYRASSDYDPLTIAFGPLLVFFAVLFRKNTTRLAAQLPKLKKEALDDLEAITKRDALKELERLQKKAARRAERERIEQERLAAEAAVAAAAEAARLAEEEARARELQQRSSRMQYKTLKPLTANTSAAYVPPPPPPPPPPPAIPADMGSPPRADVSGPDDDDDDEDEKPTKVGEGFDEWVTAVWNALQESGAYLFDHYVLMLGYESILLLLLVGISWSAFRIMGVVHFIVFVLLILLGKWRCVLGSQMVLRIIQWTYSLLILYLALTRLGILQSAVVFSSNPMAQRLFTTFVRPPFNPNNYNNQQFGFILSGGYTGQAQIPGITLDRYSVEYYLGAQADASIIIPIFMVIVMIRAVRKNDSLAPKEDPSLTFEFQYQSREQEWGSVRMGGPTAASSQAAATQPPAGGTETPPAAGGKRSSTTAVAMHEPLEGAGGPASPGSPKRPGFDGTGEVYPDATTALQILDAAFRRHPHLTNDLLKKFLRLDRVFSTASNRAMIVVNHDYDGSHSPLVTPKMLLDVVPYAFIQYFVLGFVLAIDAVTGGGNLLQVVIMAGVTFLYCFYPKVVWRGGFAYWPKALLFFIGVLFLVVLMNTPPLSIAIKNSPAVFQILGLTDDSLWPSPARAALLASQTTAAATAASSSATSGGTGSSIAAAAAASVDTNNITLPMVLSGWRVFMIWCIIIQLKLMGGFDYLEYLKNRKVKEVVSMQLNAMRKDEELQAEREVEKVLQEQEEKQQAELAKARKLRREQNVAKKAKEEMIMSASYRGDRPGSVKRINFQERPTTPVMRPQSVVSFVAPPPGSSTTATPAPSRAVSIAPASQVTSYAASPAPARKVDGGPYNLRITIVAARGLINREIAGTSDPYARLLDVNGKDILQTPKIDGSLNPNWPGAKSTTIVRLPGSVRDQTMKIMIFDRNVMVDAFLGEAVFHVQDAIEVAEQVHVGHGRKPHEWILQLYPRVKETDNIIKEHAQALGFLILLVSDGDLAAPPPMINPTMDLKALEAASLLHSGAGGGSSASQAPAWMTAAAAGDAATAGGPNIPPLPMSVLKTANTSATQSAVNSKNPSRNASPSNSRPGSVMPGGGTNRISPSRERSNTLVSALPPPPPPTVTIQTPNKLSEAEQEELNALKANDERLKKVEEEDAKAAKEGTEEVDTRPLSVILDEACVGAAESTIEFLWSVAWERKEPEKHKSKTTRERFRRALAAALRVSMVFLIVAWLSMVMAVTGTMVNAVVAMTGWGYATVMWAWPARKYWKIIILFIALTQLIKIIIVFAARFGIADANSPGLSAIFVNLREDTIASSYTTDLILSIFSLHLCLYYLFSHSDLGGTYIIIDEAIVEQWGVAPDDEPEYDDEELQRLKELKEQMEEEEDREEEAPMEEAAFYVLQSPVPTPKERRAMAGGAAAARPATPAPYYGLGPNEVTQGVTPRDLHRKSSFNKSSNSNDNNGQVAIATTPGGPAGSSSPSTQVTTMQASRVEEEDLSFQQSVETRHLAGTDLYTVTALIELLALIITVATYYGLASKPNGSLTQAVQTSLLPGPMVLVILIFALIMILDRGLYVLSASSPASALWYKFLFHLFLVIGYHLFYVIWVSTVSSGISTAGPPLFLIKAVVMILSAQQIRRGFPTLRRHDPMTHTPQGVFALLYMVYRLIPFLWDIRVMIDWIFTRTSLSFQNFLKVEDIADIIYTRYQDLTDARDHPRRGAAVEAAKKCTGAGILVTIALIVVFAPLLYYSAFNPSLGQNTVLNVQMDISLGTYSTLYSFNSIESSDGKTEAELIQRLRPELIPTDFTVSRDQQLFVLNRCSATTWAVSPSTRSSIITHLQKIVAAAAAAANGTSYPPVTPLPITIVTTITRTVSNTGSTTTPITDITMVDATLATQIIDVLQGKGNSKALTTQAPTPTSPLDPTTMMNLTSATDPVYFNLPTGVNSVTATLGGSQGGTPGGANGFIGCSLSLINELDPNLSNATVQSWCVTCQPLFTYSFAPTTNQSLPEGECLFGPGKTCDNTAKGNYTYRPQSVSPYVLLTSDQVPINNVGSVLPVQGGIIVLYTTFIVAIGNMIRGMLTGMSKNIVLSDVHDPSCLTLLVSLIFYSRVRRNPTLTPEEEAQAHWEDRQAAISDPFEPLPAGYPEAWAKRVDSLVAEELLFLQLIDLLRAPDELRDRTGLREDTYDRNGVLIPINTDVRW